MRSYPKYHQAIDEALKTALPAGSRIISVEKVQRVLDVLAPITSASDKYGPGSIIKDYLVNEEIWIKEIEKTKLGKRETPEMEMDEGRMPKMCKIL